MCLAIASVPLNVPDFRPLVRVSHAVSLWRLVAKGGGIHSQIANFFADSVAIRKPWVVLLPANGVLGWLLLHGGLACPNMKLRRDLADKGQSSTIKSIEEVPVTAVVLVKGPSFHGDAIVDRLVDQLQSDLALGEKFDVLRDVRFFRRGKSSAHSLGKYICAAMRH